MAGLIRREKTYYAVYRIGNRKKRVSLRTDVLQPAKEKLRRVESALA